MNLKECYEQMGADYKSVMERLQSEQMVGRFLKKCVENNEFSLLEQAVGEERWQDAFMHAHNIKGYGLNLSLTPLVGSSSELCEALRGGEPKGDVQGLLSRVREDYERTEKAIEELC